MRALTFGLVLCSGAWLAHAQTEAIKTRAMSLPDCIQQALERNLELRIERYNPQLALFNLKAGYGAYDPVFGASGQYDHTESGGRLLEGTDFSLRRKETDTDTFSSSFTGLTPWGMSYDLSGRVSDTDGNVFSNNVPDPYSTSSGTVSLGVTQPLVKDLWLNPTRLNIAVLKNRVKWTDQGLRQRIIDIVTRVELAYYDLKAGYKAVEVQRSALELAERLVADDIKRKEAGAAAERQPAVLEANAEAAIKRADLIAAQRNLAALDNALKQLLTDDFASLENVRLEPSDAIDAERQSFNLQDSWSKGLTLRPDFLQAKLDLEKQGIQVKINRNELYPQVDFKAAGGYAGSTREYSGVFGDIERGDQPFYYFGGQLTYPLGKWAARNNYKAAKAQYEVSQLALKKLEQDIMIQIDNAIKLAQANYERVVATRKAVKYAEELVNVQKDQLDKGKITRFEVLRYQRDLTAAQSDEIAALVQYKRSLAQLAQYEGRTLERHGINLEVK